MQSIVAAFSLKRSPLEAKPYRFPGHQQAVGLHLSGFSNSYYTRIATICLAAYASVRVDTVGNTASPLHFCNQI